MKTGWKTSEFWMSALTSVSSITLTVAGILPAKYAAIATAISTMAYSISRGLAKQGPAIA